MRTKDQLKAQRIQSYINEFFRKNYRSPSLREIEAGTGISRQTAHRYLADMCDDGSVRNLNGNYVTGLIESYSSTSFDNRQPIGSISCGPPQMEEAWSGNSANDFFHDLGYDGSYYILRANGDSMKGAGIDEGDCIIVRKSKTANYGEIVVAMNEHNENTLKRLLFDPKLNRPVLHPENPDYEDIIPDELIIQGIAVSIIKRIH